MRLPNAAARSKLEHMFEKAEGYFFFGLLGVIAIVCFLIVSPYVPTLLFTAALAVTFRPVYEHLSHWLRSPNLGALATILLVALIVFVPLTLIGLRVFHEAQGAYGSLSGWSLQGLAGNGFVQQILSRLPEGLEINYQDLGQKGLTWLINSIGFVFSNLLLIALNIFICILSLFFFLKDGDRIRDRAIMLSPLPDKYDKQILDRLGLTVSSVFRVTLVMALCQGLLAGIGFALFGVPNPALWGSAAAVSALIPGVGTALVVFPIVIYTFLANGVLDGVGMAIWGALAIGMIDNVLGPKLSGKWARIHPLVIFLGVIGGLRFFGPLGFVIGPLVFSLLFTLFDVYTITRQYPSGDKPDAR